VLWHCIFRAFVPKMRFKSIIHIVVFVAVILFHSIIAAEPQHGLSTFGDLKYPADFNNFAYVRPNAPKGGEVRLADYGSFDNLNPFILKGIKLRGLGARAMLLPFESLMVTAEDEPDSVYGLVAKSAEVSIDGSRVQFYLRPEARWHDGRPITATDVTYSFQILKAKGRPFFKLSYRDILSARALDTDIVQFDFVPGAGRGLPRIVAGMPIISMSYFKENNFDRTTLVPPLGSGPYKVSQVDPGRALVYKRVQDYWGSMLPVNRGRYNFDVVRFDFYRDRSVAFEAFKSGDFDFHEEFMSKNWATGYDFPAVKDGRILRTTVPDESPSGTQAFFINSRKEKFSDRRVRKALGYAFDFEWTNKNLFYGLYRRTSSMFENSDLRARGVPEGAELELINVYRSAVPVEVVTEEYQPPTTDGSGDIRSHLLSARKLLEEAGWRVIGGRLINDSGQQMEIEFLSDVPAFERIIGPFVRNLERLGIAARIRNVDSSQYTNRVQNYDFDIITARFVLPRTPGAEQHSFWGSAGAELPGGLNYAGVKDPVIDSLIEKLGDAQNRAELKPVIGAMDRVLMWGHYTIPQWFKASHFIAYWDKFGRPYVKPKYSLSFLDTWWVDSEKQMVLDAALKEPN